MYFQRLGYFRSLEFCTPRYAANESGSAPPVVLTTVVTSCSSVLSALSTALAVPLSALSPATPMTLVILVDTVSLVALLSVSRAILAALFFGNTGLMLPEAIFFSYS